MVKCPSCAIENPEDNKFCTGCGKTLAPPQPPVTGAAEAPARFCNECGAKIPADSSFCTSCGQAFGAASAATPPAAGPAPAAASGDAQSYLAGLDLRLAQ